MSDSGFLTETRESHSALSKCKQGCEHNLFHINRGLNSPILYKIHFRNVFKQEYVFLAYQ